MAIDFTLTAELEEIRSRVRSLVDDVVKPAEDRIEGRDGHEPLTGQERVGELIDLRKQARAGGLWLPHMPAEWGGMGLGHVALAMVQAEAAKSYYGPWVLNCQAPDEVHRMRIAQRTIAAYSDEGTTRRATGNPPI